MQSHNEKNEYFVDFPWQRQKQHIKVISLSTFLGGELGGGKIERKFVEMAIYNNLLWNEKENKNNCFSSIKKEKSFIWSSNTRHVTQHKLI